VVEKEAEIERLGGYRTLQATMRFRYRFLIYLAVISTVVGAYARLNRPSGAIFGDGPCPQCEKLNRGYGS